MDVLARSAALRAYKFRQALDAPECFATGNAGPSSIAHVSMQLSEYKSANNSFTRTIYNPLEGMGVILHNRQTTSIVGVEF
jgi:hypothetical protein